MRDGGWIVTLGGQPTSYPSVASILAGLLPEPTLPIDSTDPAAPCSCFYTSGTTGDPKAIISSHNRYAVAATLPAVLGLTRDDVLYTGLSPPTPRTGHHPGMALHAGTRRVISVRFTKSRLWTSPAPTAALFNLLGGMTTALYAEPPARTMPTTPVDHTQRGHAGCHLGGLRPAV